jgi:hypothetical protein
MLQNPVPKRLWGPLRNEMRAIGTADTRTWRTRQEQHATTTTQYEAVFEALAVPHGDQPARRGVDRAAPRFAMWS